jgi:hypothetical protein
MLGTDVSAKALADMLVQWDLEAGNTPHDHWLALTVLQYGDAASFSGLGPFGCRDVFAFEKCFN